MSTCRHAGRREEVINDYRFLHLSLRAIRRSSCAPISMPAVSSKTRRYAVRLPGMRTRILRPGYPAVSGGLGNGVVFMTNRG
jgi:hypothetical protein